MTPSPGQPAPALGYFGLSFSGASVGGSGGVSGVRLQAYARTVTDDRPFGVANDYIASALGRAAGVPVPPGALVELSGSAHGYVSMGFSDRGDRPPPVIPNQLTTNHPWECTGIIAFDQWVSNSDRHDENLAYLPKRGVAAFDHDLAILGRIEEPPEIAHTLETFRDTPVQGHLLAPHLTTDHYFDGWFARIAAVTRPEIQRVTSDCVQAGLITQPLASAVIDILEYRKSRIAKYIRATVSEYTGIRSWALAGDIGGEQ